MPVYEYYCDNCDKVFDSLQPIAKSDQPVPCPYCDRKADRIMPTTVATMSRRKGLRERVPFHHFETRGGEKKRTIARVKPKPAASRSPKGKGTKTKKG